MTAAWMQRRRYNPWRQLPQTYTQLLAWFGVRARIGDVWRDSTGYHLERIEDDEDGVVFRLWCDKRDRRPIRASDLALFRRTLDRLGHVGVWTTPDSHKALNDDPWEQSVGIYLKRRREVTVRELYGCVGLKQSKADMRSEKRLVAILRQLGWRTTGNPVRRDGARVRVWTPPSSQGAMP